MNVIITKGGKNERKKNNDTFFRDDGCNDGDHQNLSGNSLEREV